MTAALRCGAAPPGAVERTLPPMLDVYALAAVCRYPAVRDEARRLGIADMLFEDEAAAVLFRQFMGLPVDWHRLCPEARAQTRCWLDAIGAGEQPGFAPVLSSDPDCPAWGLHCLRALAAQRGERWLPATLQWAAVGMEAGTVDLPQVDRHVRGVLDVAMGRSEGRVA